ncbi:MAG: bile acid:sodium symporter family protein [Flavobacteriales bacterium]|nr:bile acid:sodium symporter family protein [Flavobacteriales bacterium]NCA19847.1 bile acid:sodium symporter family protein [Crocinitomicaceae bacterium]
MESSAITTIFLPLALGIIMLGLGLSLTLEDFKRVVKFPKVILIGLFCQMIILPIACFLIAKGFGLPPELAVGLMLLAASPGGSTANLFSHLANGDVALNISLTAFNSILSILMLPLIVNFSLDYFMESGQVVPLQFKKIIEVFAIVLVPVGIGMVVNAKKPSISLKLEKPVKIISAVFLVLIIVSAIIKEKAHIVEYFQQVGLPALLFNVLSLCVGYFIPRLLKIEKKQSIAIGMEIGIHNGTMAIFIATTVLNNSVMSIPPAIYSLIMFFTAGIFGYIVSRKTA